MEGSCEILQGECAEILVKTDSETLPRGDDCRNFSSFEKLIHAAIGLEKDALKEHDYAFHNTPKFCVRKDHSYSSKKQHRKTQSVENLTVANKPLDHCYYKCLDTRQVSQCYIKGKWKNYNSMCFPDDSFISYNSQESTNYIRCIPHYRSNDSALDVTGFDTVSDKCLSTDNIHLKTVDVITEAQIFSGISDPDISKMTIASETETMSTSLLKNPSMNVFDHTYSHITAEKDAVFDHTYNTYDKSNERRESFPSSAGIKRLRSNENLNLSKMAFFKRQDFKKSPFLDQSYELLDRQKLCRKHGSLKHRKRDKTRENDIEANHHRQQRSLKSGVSEPNQILLDHTYGEVEDSTDDIVNQIQKSEKTEHNTLDFKNRWYDHSYVKESLKKMDSMEALSDSGTESLNDEEEAEMSTTFERMLSCIAKTKDHTYVK